MRAMDHKTKAIVDDLAAGLGYTEIKKRHRCTSRTIARIRREYLPPGSLRKKGQKKADYVDKVVVDALRSRGWTWDQIAVKLEITNGRLDHWRRATSYVDPSDQTTILDLCKVRHDRARGMSYAQLALKYGLSRETIRRRLGRTDGDIAKVPRCYRTNTRRARVLRMWAEGAPYTLIAHTCGIDVDQVNFYIDTADKAVWTCEYHDCGAQRRSAGVCTPGDGSTACVLRGPRLTWPTHVVPFGWLRDGDGIRADPQTWPMVKTLVDMLNNNLAVEQIAKLLKLSVKTVQSRNRGGGVLERRRRELGLKV